MELCSPNFDIPLGAGDKSAMVAVIGAALFGWRFDSKGAMTAK